VPVEAVTPAAPAPLSVTAPARPVPAATAAVTSPARTVPTTVRHAVKPVRAKTQALADLSDAAYAAKLQAELCQARQIFCGLNRNGRYPGS
jgi:hypothetical protein